MAKKGTAILLDHGCGMEAVVDAVRERYADKRSTAAGWHGVAVVNVKPDDNGDEALTFLVKGTKSGFEVYGLLGAVQDEICTTAGEFQPAS